MWYLASSSRLVYQQIDSGKTKNEFDVRRPVEIVNEVIGSKEKQLNTKSNWGNEFSSW